ncbi:MAG: triose-phosphate isomerase [Acetomicrobium sp.]|nr:triose-phosphate isomerase [Acetomicrobium sp.]MDR9770826.1 triose-phosphate isomerase [Acetomicrobium sp.]
MNRVPFLAGNWKMNKGPLEAENFIKNLASTIHDNESLSKAVKAGIVEIGVFPPFVSLERAKKGISISGIPMSLGAQNMHWEDNGAFTGEVSGEMLKEVGCEYVILGHSERRHIFQETNEIIGKKMKKGSQHRT